MVWVIFIGFIIGAFSEFLMPRHEPKSYLLTILIGVSGAMLVNWLGRSFGLFQQGDYYNYISAVFGSVLILFIFRMFNNVWIRRNHLL